MLRFISLFVVVYVIGFIGQEVSQAQTFKIFNEVSVSPQGNTKVFLPPTTPYQKVEFNISGGQHGQVVHLNGNDIVFVRPNAGVRKLNVEATVQLQKHQPNTAARALPQAVRPYLGASYRINPQHPKVVVAAKQAKKATPVETIKSIASYIKDNFEQKTGAQFKDISEVLDRGYGHPTDFAYVFVGIARACGIPTRVATGSKYYIGHDMYVHCWPECFVGSEWIPVDPMNPNGFGTQENQIKVFVSDGLQGLQNPNQWYEAWKQWVPANAKIRHELLEQAVPEFAYRISTEIEAQGQNEDGNIKVLLPSSTPRQKVEYKIIGGSYDEIIHRNGNAMAFIQPEIGVEKLKVEVIVRFQAHNYLKGINVSNTVVPENIKPYLGKSYRIDPSNPIIIELSNKYRSADPVKTALAIATYLDTNVTYKCNDETINYKDVSELLTRKPEKSELYAECGGFSDAFVAIARACGVPARRVWGFNKKVSGVINGIEYNNAMISHNWAEFYVDGQWIPVDPQKPYTLKEGMPPFIRMVAFDDVEIPSSRESFLSFQQWPLRADLTIPYQVVRD